MSTALSSVAPLRRRAVGGARHFPVHPVQDRGRVKENRAGDQAGMAAEQQQPDHWQREQGVDDGDVDRPDAGDGQHQPGDALRNRPVQPARDQAVARLAGGADHLPEVGKAMAGAGAALDPTSAAPRSRSISASVAAAGGRRRRSAARSSRRPLPPERTARAAAATPAITPVRRGGRRKSRSACHSFFSSQHAAPYRKGRHGKRFPAKRRPDHGNGGAADIRPPGPQPPARAPGSAELLFLSSACGAACACCSGRRASRPNMVSVMSAVASSPRPPAFVGLAWPANALAGLVLHAALACRRRRRRRSRPDDGQGLGDRRAGRRRLRLFRQRRHVFRLRLHGGRRWGAWAWILAVAPAPAMSSRPTMRRPSAGSISGGLMASPWLRNARAAGDDEVFRRDTWFTRYFGFWAVGYVWLSNRMTPCANPIDRALDAAAGDPARRSGSARLVRQTMRRPCSCRNCSAPTRRPS